MKDVLKFEELGMFCLSIILYNMLGYSWWLYVLLILTPDLSMIGYLINSKIGGITYNVFHHKGIAIILYLIGTFTYNYVFIIAGIIIFGHASIDRFLGFGLKYLDSFNHTHLGMIGNKNK
ncbi:MAG: DUF4260 domain-containing protein [Bacteroidetes bacterium]|nr:DUF4260 domain-containing protein [Bacteroidota bacterium]